MWGDLSLHDSWRSYDEIERASSDDGVDPARVGPVEQCPLAAHAEGNALVNDLRLNAVLTSVTARA